MSDRLIFGTLYPAYSSYKAVKSKDVREYVSMNCITTYNEHLMPYCTHIYGQLFQHHLIGMCSLTFKFHNFLLYISTGKMDDVLDNICTVHNSWSDHRFILVLVSEIMPSCSFPTKGVPLIKWWNDKELEMMMADMTHLLSLLKAPILLWAKNCFYGVVTFTIHKGIQCAV